jgi:hypothetical protein
MRIGRPVKASPHPAVVDSGGLHAQQIRRLLRKCGGQAEPTPARRGLQGFLRELLPGVLFSPRAAERNAHEATEARKHMTAQPQRYSQLSPARQNLIRLCQTINFGSIENLEVRDGEPTFDPPPVMLRDLKLDSDDGPRPELALSDFILSNEILRLMSHLTEMRFGIIRRVEVRGGLPRRILLEQVLQPTAGLADLAGGSKCSGRIPLKQDALGYRETSTPDE